MSRKPPIKHYKENGVVHANGISDGEYLLCGQAPEGDDMNPEIDEVVKTNEPINCPLCIKIIKHCKRIKRGIKWELLKMQNLKKYI
jgi:hypothetical protein